MNDEPRYLKLLIHFCCTLWGKLILGANLDNHICDMKYIITFIFTMFNLCVTKCIFTRSKIKRFRKKNYCFSKYEPAAKLFKDGPVRHSFQTQFLLLWNIHCFL